MLYEPRIGAVSNSMADFFRRIVPAIALMALAFVVTGCGSDQIEATNKLVQQQQEQIEKQQQEIEAIKASQNQSYTPGAATSASASPGGCDKQVEQVATQRGGDKFASGDYLKALGYYQDALTACPNDDRANVNVARTYEALGKNAQAIKYYRKAADTPGPTETDAEDEAKAALLRLQASRIP
jgi:tetratricopeptide (TPR) repeat protein